MHAHRSITSLEPVNSTHALGMRTTAGRNGLRRRHGLPLPSPWLKPMWHYDLVPAREDPNIVFPVDRLRELVDEGILGSLAPQAVACMGGIYSVRRAEQDLAPAIVEAISSMDGPSVDLVLLVPV